MRKLLYLAVLLSCCVCWGQSDTGTPSSELLAPINAYESVNLGNLNIMLVAPVRSKAGPIPFSGRITENVQVYIASGFTTYLSTAAQFSKQLDFGYWRGRLTATDNGSGLCPDGVTHTNFKVTASISDEHGTVHPVSAHNWDSQGCVYTGVLDIYTTDNTGYEVVIQPGDGTGTIATHAVVYDKMGNVSNLHLPLASGTVTDPHGNQLTYTYASPNNTFTDELTSTPIVSYSTASVTSTTYVYNDGNGTAQNIVASSPSVTMLPAFSCSGLTNAQSTINPLASVSYPDGSSVSFTYEKTAANNLTGRLKTVTLPTGGIFTHNYLGGTNGDGLWCDSGKVSNATMTITNGAGTWTFARVIGTGTYPNRNSTTTVTRPDGSVVVYTFRGDLNPILLSKVTKDTDGTTVLDTMTYCYDSTFSSCNPQTVMLRNPTWIRAYHTVPGVATNAEVDTQFDTYGNAIEVDRFDYGPTLVSKTLTTMGDWNGSSCGSLVSIHIVGKPCDVQVQNASSAILSHARFNYDNATGDLLNTYAFKDATNFLTSTNTYNTNGTPATTTGPDGVQTTFAYNGTGGCNLLLPTSATNAIGTTSTTWDCNGGVPLTSTDLNGLTVTTTRGDPLYRVTQVSDNGGQAPVLYTYPSVTRSSQHMTFNSNASIVDTTTNLNSLGQVQCIQHQTAPSSANYDTVCYFYDLTGHRTGISTACTTTLGGTCSTHAVDYAYDGMGRKKTQTVNTATHGVLTFTYPTGDIKTVLTPAPTGENSKIVQIEKNGLGWTTSVCQVVTSGLSGTGACGQRTAATGYKTTYTRNALGVPTQISRNSQAGATPLNENYTLDFLSRITQATIPETGTKQAFYDSITSTCSTFASSQGLTINVSGGQLAQTTDNAGKVLCYNHDPAGRIASIFPTTSITTTPAQYFCYDHQCTGSDTNAIGRLWAAGTTFPPYTATTSQKHYFYDVYGRVNSIHQLSPHLAGFFQPTATYFDNGVVASIGNIPGMSNVTYGIDGEGRPKSATQGATTLVSSVTYDPASNPLVTTYGNGDTDTNTWDAASQNMTQAQFKLNGVTDTHAFTWSPNGTLKTETITDNIAGSGDTRTCNKTYDDLVRIASHNCGAFWTESYTWSANDESNVTKSGNLIFNPGYNATNNHFNAPYTYDGNGYLLHDGTLGIDYTWELTGGLASAGTATIVNNTNGDMVEKTVSGTTTYYVDSPVGMLGPASSLTTMLAARIPLPGGGTNIVGSTFSLLYHKDQEGSGRMASNFTARTLSGVFCYGPMGELYCGTSSGSFYQGTAQDTTTGLNDFDATRYSGAMGRSINP